MDIKKVLGNSFVKGVVLIVAIQSAKTAMVRHKINKAEKDFDRNEELIYEIAMNLEQESKKKSRDKMAKAREIYRKEYLNKEIKL